MDWPETCAAVIPCLNEAARIADLVGQVRRQLPTVFVIDDGSDDATGSQAEGAGARVCRHAVSRGKGAALQIGLAAARQAGFEWALAMDGDGQHDPADIARLLTAAGVPGTALVVGNRMPEGAHLPFVRRWVNRWMSRRISRLAGRPLPDTQCGFRVVHLPAWATLSLRAEHFEFESDLLLAMLRSGKTVTFVPVQVVASTRPSRISPVVDAWRWLRWWHYVRQGCQQPTPAPVPASGANSQNQETERITPSQ